jgi:hypothetical protein
VPITLSDSLSGQRHKLTNTQIRTSCKKQPGFATQSPPKATIWCAAAKSRNGPKATKCCVAREMTRWAKTGPSAPPQKSNYSITLSASNCIE